MCSSDLRLITLKPLSAEDLVLILKRALTDQENGLGNLDLEIDQDNLSLIANLANGDARSALNILETASFLSKKIDKEIILEAVQKMVLRHDKKGEFENIVNDDNFKYPIKIVFSIENDYIVIITVYPVKRGLK